MQVVVLHSMIAWAQAALVLLKLERFLDKGESTTGSDASSGTSSNAPTVIGRGPPGERRWDTGQQWRRQEGCAPTATTAKGKPIHRPSLEMKVLLQTTATEKRHDRGRGGGAAQRRRPQLHASQQPGSQHGPAGRLQTCWGRGHGAQLCAPCPHHAAAETQAPAGCSTCWRASGSANGG
jgi:hypothetical protein